MMAEFNADAPDALADSGEEIGRHGGTTAVNVLGQTPPAGPQDHYHATTSVAALEEQQPFSQVVENAEQHRTVSDGRPSKKRRKLKARKTKKLKAATMETAAATSPGEESVEEEEIGYVHRINGILHRFLTLSQVVSHQEILFKMERNMSVGELPAGSEMPVDCEKSALFDNICYEESISSSEVFAYDMKIATSIIKEYSYIADPPYDGITFIKRLGVPNLDLLLNFCKALDRYKNSSNKGIKILTSIKKLRKSSLCS